jgi:hypothetical protein
MEPKKKQPKSYLINVGKQNYQDIRRLAKDMALSPPRFIAHMIRSVEILRTLNQEAKLVRPRKETR